MANQVSDITVRLSPAAEAIFREFVKNANAIGALEKTTRTVKRAPDDDDDDVVTTAAEMPAQVFLLTSRKTPVPAPDAPRSPDESGATVVRLPSPDTQRREAALVVPEVARVSPPPPPVREKSEDGQMPAGELDRILSDMQVLLRYGNLHQVSMRLDALCKDYPNDLLLLRRIAEFHLENGHREPAMEALFTLAARLFERRNVEGMRKALEQVLVLEPDNRRAFKLLGLLEQRVG